jgi:hypothetical protein
MPDAFLDKLTQRFASEGYRVERDVAFPGRTFAVAAKQQFFNWLRFGFIEPVFLVSELASLDSASVGEYTFNCFRTAVLHRGPIFRMRLPIHLFIFPVAVGHGVEAGVRDAIREEPPEKQPGVFLFPVLYDLDAGAAHYFQKTPYFGSANYKLARQLVTPLFGP